MDDLDIERAVTPLPAAYHRHLGRLVALARADERVRGLWLSGSLARGDADAGSDLDVVLALADDVLDDFLARWRSWMGQVCELLIASEVRAAPGVITVVTTDMCRIDLVVEAASAVSESPHRRRIAVLDRDSLSERVPAEAPPPGPDREAISALIAEFWRVQSIFPAMVEGRGDLIASLAGVHLAHRLLYDVFVACNQPLPPMGVKKFRARLHDDQAHALEALPPTAADRDTLVDAAFALCRAMAGPGRVAVEAVGVDYPAELAEAVTAHLRTSLGR